MGKSVGKLPLKSTHIQASLDSPYLTLCLPPSVLRRIFEKTSLGPFKLSSEMSSSVRGTCLGSIQTPFPALARQGPGAHPERI
jgi:hypothetical protein